MSLSHNLKCFLGDIDGFGDVGVGEGGVDEVVVVVGEEYSPLDALRDPLLMEHQSGVVGYAEVEERGRARDAEVEAVAICGGDESRFELFALFDESARHIEPLHLVYAGNSRGEGHGGEPIAARVRHSRNGVFEEILAAERGNIISVRKRLAEADKVCLEAEIVVGARDVKAESRADVVNDEDGAVFGTHFANFLPKALGGHDVIGKIAVHIGLRNDRRDLTRVILEDLTQAVEVVPIDVDIVHYVLGEDAGIVDLLRPGRDAVVVTLEKDDLFAVGIGSRGHNGEGGDVVSVLCEERPIGACDGIDEELGELDHFGRGQSRAVAESSLRCSRGVNIGVIVAENVRAVGAHIVDKLVAVKVPDISAFCLRGEERERLDGGIASLGGSEMAVDARGDDLHCAGKRLAAFIVIIDLSHISPHAR